MTANLTALDLPSLDEIAVAIDVPPDRWLNNCHGISLAVVQSGILADPGPDCRVVRGFASGYGIGSQHSWISLGDPWRPETIYVDVTAHRWGRVDGIVVVPAADAYLGSQMGDRGHTAFGYLPGSIFEYGRPAAPGPDEDAYALTDLPSSDAALFAEILGPLTAYGWSSLFGFPKRGWPYREILTAAVEQIPRVEVLTPIDLVGHGTDRNPSGLYW